MQGAHVKVVPHAFKRSHGLSTALPLQSDIYMDGLEQSRMDFEALTLEVFLDHVFLVVSF